MSRWLLALLFAFGSVTFLTGCPADDGGDDTDAAETDGDAEKPAEGEGDGSAEGEGSGTE